MTLRTLFTSLVLAGVSLTAATSASAAPGPALPILGSPNTITAGVFLPSSGAAKSAGGSTQLDIEFHYGLPIPNPTPLKAVFSIGVETGSKSGGHSTIIPVTVGAQVSLGGGVYAGAGVGYYFLNQHRNDTFTDQLSTSTRFGGYGELGYSLPTGLISVSAKYQAVQRADGVIVAVGLHF